MNYLKNVIKYLNIVHTFTIKISIGSKFRKILYIGTIKYQKVFSMFRKKCISKQ